MNIMLRKFFSFPHHKIRFITFRLLLVKPFDAEMRKFRACKKQEPFHFMA